jgi:hypothetical protein
VATLAVISAWGIALEKVTNAFLNKFFARRKAAAA